GRNPGPRRRNASMRRSWRSPPTPAGGRARAARCAGDWLTGATRFTGSARQGGTMPFRLRFQSASGFTYVELLCGLVIAALVFPPAYRFAVAVLNRKSDGGAEAAADADIDVLCRDLRCALDDPRTPFHAFGGELTFLRATGAGLRTTRYRGDPGGGNDVRRDDAPLSIGWTEWSLRYFNGESWTETWGWDAARGVPTEGMRGLPLAVEITGVCRGRRIRRVTP